MISNREPNALKLLEILEDYSYRDSIMVGHQNAGHIGVSIKEHDGTESDIKNVVGKMPAVVGIDTLSFNGYEGKFKDLVKIVKNLHKQGVIITLSSHMPNFSLGGPDDFFDYSPNDTSGDVGRRIMPGGDLNEKYLKFLDKIAQFCKECVDVEGECIPMIFRPFHEDNGDWFWWGSKHLPDEDYIKLFRYTVQYLCVDCDIKSLLFAYSPNGVIACEEHYMRRYPGDDIIDIMGMDLYHDRPKKNDGFYKKLTSSLDVVFKCAQEHAKIPALTEIGLRVLDSAPDKKYYEGFSPEGNTMKHWFTEILDSLLSSEGGSRISYMLFWANFSDTQFWVPYVNGDFKHELVDDFVQYAEDKGTVFAPVFEVK